MGALGGVKGYGTMAQMAVNKMDPTAKPPGTLAREKAEEDLRSAKAKARSFLAMSPQEQAEVRGRSNQAIADRNQASYMDRVGASQELRDDAVAVMGTIGGVPSTLSVDVQTGVVTDTVTGDTVAGKDADAAVAAVNLDMQEASMSPSPSQSKQSDQAGGVAGPDPDKSGEVSTPGGGPETASDVSGGYGPQSGGPSEAPSPETEAEVAVGGFIPKRKKQKKMKRGGLASR